MAKKTNTRLWNFFDGEPYLDNPRLWILNPAKKRRKTKMARRRRLARNPRRRRRSYRANAFVPLPNPRRHRRRRTFRHNPMFKSRRRRSYRKNPFSMSSIGGKDNILGFPIKQVMLAGGAVVAAPFIERQLMKFMPVSFSVTTAGRWVGKIGAAVATGYIAKLAMGNEASKLAYLVLGANIVADAVSEFMPAATTGTGFFAPLSGLGANGYVQGGMNAIGPYTGVSPLMVAPMSPMFDPYKPVF